MSRRLQNRRLRPLWNSRQPIEHRQQARRHETVDQRTDIYSLGVLLYELLIQQNPFLADEKSDIFTNINTVTPPAISSVKIEIPPEVDTIVAKAMARKPKDRYKNMEQFVLTLEELVQDV